MEKAGSPYEVTDDWRHVHVFEAETPHATLEPVWGKLPVGYVTVVCRGVAVEVAAKGETGRRTSGRSRPLMWLIYGIINAS